MGEFKAVTKRAAGGNNGISEAQRADVNAEIDRASGGHIGCRIPRSASDAARIPAQKDYVFMTSISAIRGVNITS
jgi:hypothetical protein